jgi:predicted site-specific integrase-resolvase
MEWTIKEFAAHERVNERTVRRWIEKGAVPVRRTPGGGIRIPLCESHAPILRLSDMAKSDNSGHPAS